MKIKFEWERLNENYSRIRRSKVFGGWIVHTYNLNTDDSAMSESMVFVPDPNHEWEIE